MKPDQRSRAQTFGYIFPQIGIDRSTRLRMSTSFPMQDQNTQGEREWSMQIQCNHQTMPTLIQESQRTGVSHQHRNYVPNGWNNDKQHTDLTSNITSSDRTLYEFGQLTFCINNQFRRKRSPELNTFYAFPYNL